MKKATLDVRMQQHGDDGWFFAMLPGMTGVFAFGPTAEVTLERLMAAGNLMITSRAEEEKSVSLNIRPHAWRNVDVSKELVAA